MKSPDFSPISLLPRSPPRCSVSWKRVSGRCFAMSLLACKRGPLQFFFSLSELFTPLGTPGYGPSFLVFPSLLTAEKRRMVVLYPANLTLFYLTLFLLSFFSLLSFIFVYPKPGETYLSPNVAFFNPFQLFSQSLGPMGSVKFENIPFFLSLLYLNFAFPFRPLFWAT